MQKCEAMLVDNVINLRLFLIGPFSQGVIGGLGLNLMVALAAFVVSFLVGHLLAIGRMSSFAPFRLVCTAYIEMVRAVPFLIVLFWFFFSIPILLRITPSPLWIGLIALSAYATAYQAEFIRSGIQSVPKDAIDAARSLGLSRRATWLTVVLPQAHRRMLPTYASYFTSMFKDSAALYLLGLVDLMQIGLIVAERHPGHMLQAYMTVAALFFTVCWIASRLSQFLEVRLSPRQPEHPAAQVSLFKKLHKFRPLKEKKNAHA